MRWQTESPLGLFAEGGFTITYIRFVIPSPISFHCTVRLHLPELLQLLHGHFRAILVKYRHPVFSRFQFALLLSSQFRLQFFQCDHINKILEFYFPRLNDVHPCNPTATRQNYHSTTQNCPKMSGCCPKSNPTATCSNPTAPHLHPKYSQTSSPPAPPKLSENVRLGTTTSPSNPKSNP